MSWQMSYVNAYLKHAPSTSCQNHCAAVQCTVVQAPIILPPSLLALALLLLLPFAALLQISFQPHFHNLICVPERCRRTEERERTEKGRTDRARAKKGNSILPPSPPSSRLPSSLARSPSASATHAQGARKVNAVYTRPIIFVDFQSIHWPLFLQSRKVSQTT